MPSTRTEEVLARHRESLMRLPGVVGVAQGICDRAPCIRVFLADSRDAPPRAIPDSIEGVPVRVEVTGLVRARDRDD